MQLRRRMLAWTMALPLLSLREDAAAAPAGLPLDANVQDTLRSLNILTWRTSQHFALEAPDVAENGALVPVEVSAAITGVNRIVLIAQGNPFPLLADVHLEKDALPWLEVRIKLAASTYLEAYAEVAGQWYQTRRFVRVIAGGCGQG